MHITQKSALVEGKEYWHLYVENDCHWKISVKPSIYLDNENWDNMIVFDDENDAKVIAGVLQGLICPFLIR